MTQASPALGAIPAGLTLEQFKEALATRGCSPSDVCQLEAQLPQELTAPMWRLLAAECAWATEEELCPDSILDYEPPRPRAVSGRRPSAFIGPRYSREDPLLAIAPAEYVEYLADVEVPTSGVVRCPLPGHDDRTPSFKVYPDPRGGVWCHGCQRGGTIYDFASALQGGPTGSALCGQVFREVRASLLERFCHAGSVSA